MACTYKWYNSTINNLFNFCRELILTIGRQDMRLSHEFVKYAAYILLQLSKIETNRLIYRFVIYWTIFEN